MPSSGGTPPLRAPEGRSREGGAQARSISLDLALVLGVGLRLCRRDEHLDLLVCAPRHGPASHRLPPPPRGCLEADCGDGEEGGDDEEGGLAELRDDRRHHLARVEARVPQPLRQHPPEVLVVTLVVALAVAVALALVAFGRRPRRGGGVSAAPQPLPDERHQRKRKRQHEHRHAKLEAEERRRCLDDLRQQRGRRRRRRRRRREEAAHRSNGDDSILAERTMEREEKAWRGSGKRERREPTLTFLHRPSMKSGFCSWCIHSHHRRTID